MARQVDESALLTLDEIRARLEAESTASPSYVSGLCLRDSTLSIEGLNSWKEASGITLGSDVEQLLLRYDFNNLSVGMIHFSYERDHLDWVRRMNTVGMGQPWWGEGPKPEDLNLIATSERHGIVVNAASGVVFAVADGEEGDRLVRVADDFVLFLRGAGTLFVARLEGSSSVEQSDRVGREVGAAPRSTLWRQIGE